MIRKTVNSAQDVYKLFYDNSHINGRYTAYIRGKRSKTFSVFLKEYSTAFQFPYYYGENWYAWDECATDLDWLSFDSIALIIDDYDMLFIDEPDTACVLADVEEEIQYIEEYWRNMSIEFIAYACTNCSVGQQIKHKKLTNGLCNKLLYSRKNKRAEN